MKVAMIPIVQRILIGSSLLFLTACSRVIFLYVDLSAMDLQIIEFADPEVRKPYFGESIPAYQSMLGGTELAISDDSEIYVAGLRISKSSDDGISLHIEDVKPASPGLEGGGCWHINHKSDYLKEVIFYCFDGIGSAVSASIRVGDEVLVLRGTIETSGSVISIHKPW